MPTATDRNHPFIFGAQYYRAPTPEQDCWETDLRRMQELGFNHVKFWVQWRWSHRAPGRFYFDDIDRLMDLAHRYGLSVTLNTIFDVAPSWVLNEFPDSFPVTADGGTVYPRAYGFRPVGGFPGPCLSHPGAAQARMQFLATVVERYANHPAMGMWDVWNEPEQNFIHRKPVVEKLTCHCAHCRVGFIQWLQDHHASVDALNTAWGRCYESWEEVELPKTPDTIKDFVDFRRFHLSLMTREAKARIDCVRKTDPNHATYLHVVPHTLRIFNALTGVDDFAMADLCDVFASSTNGGAIWPNQLTSAARGKTCYNVESHINAGQTSLHQRALQLGDILGDLLPQIGAGISGFLFWQYRPEMLGTESPAWGLVKPDGSDRPVTLALQEFGRKLAPYMEELSACHPELAETAIWKSNRNEIFHFSANGGLDKLADNIEGYRVFFRRRNIPTRYINDTLLEDGALEGIKLLILPDCYYLSTAEANTLDRWLRAGGILLCEAHLAAYNDDTGRHERSVPGAGLAQSWGIREVDSSASIHLQDSAPGKSTMEMNPDVRKALGDSAGGRFFPITLHGGKTIFGADTCAQLAGDGITSLGRNGNRSIIVSLPVGNGTVFYCGTHLGAGLELDREGSDALLARIMDAAGISQGDAVQADDGIRADMLFKDNQPAFIILHNAGKTPASAKIMAEGTWQGLYKGTVLSTGETIGMDPGDAELFIGL
ncbi:MAG: hypothetical protein DRP64_01955 [Verrucomicrobia bacterium]|nr:MAG: hypothetical protein DRP64_01955 [Verrucomicrobiota bacterium]